MRWMPSSLSAWANWLAAPTVEDGRLRELAVPALYVGSDADPMVPPWSSAMRLEIARPSPVPPYSRVIEPSACRKASNTSACLSGAMPMADATLLA